MSALPGQHRAAAGRRPDDSGLTLLEVLVALVILGLGLAFVVQGVAQGIAVRRVAAETQELALLVQDRLNNLLARREAPEGPEEGRRGALRWRIEPEDGPGDAGETGAIVVRVSAEAPSGRAFEVLTLMPPPGEER